jgi:hypothetical protein
MKKIPFLLLVVTLMLSVGFVFAETPQKSAPAKRGVKKLHRLPAPVAPNVVLYDQYDNGGGGNSTSQDFEAALDAYDSFGADDFVVPSGEIWTIDEVDVQGTYTGGPAESFHVFFYSDSAGLPGTNVYTGLAQSYSDGGTGTDFVITLSPAAVLTEGTYWVSVQARQDFGTAGQWFWNDRSVQSGNAAAWQNPGGGFGTTCSTWGVRTTCLGFGAPDNMFRLAGTIGVPCDYSNDFNDTTREWIEEKPTVTQPGDGFLHFTPLKKKAIAVADSSFAGASTGIYTFDVQFSGGFDPKNWLYIARVDKKNQLEVLAKVSTGKLVVKDRLGSVLAKAKADFAWAASTPYQIVVTYDGINIDVSVNGTPVIVDFVPSRILPIANIGAAAKDNTLLLDNVCVE